MCDAHVVGHNVDNQAHAELLQAFGEVGELFLRANFGVETGVVGDVIPVAGAADVAGCALVVGDTLEPAASSCLASGEETSALAARPC